MVRVARTRANDTLLMNESFQETKELYGVDLSNFKQSDDDVTIGISVNKRRNTLPSYDIRKNLSWRRIGIRRWFQNNDITYC